MKKVWCRNSVITKDLSGLKVLIHNGKSFSSVFISEGKVGKKFGIFSFSKTRAVYKKKNKK